MTLTKLGKYVIRNMGSQQYLYLADKPPRLVAFNGDADTPAEWRLYPGDITSQ